MKWIWIICLPLPLYSKQTDQMFSDVVTRASLEMQIAPADAQTFKKGTRFFLPHLENTGRLFLYRSPQNVWWTRARCFTRLGFIELFRVITISRFHLDLDHPWYNMNSTRITSFILIFSHLLSSCGRHTRGRRSRPSAGCYCVHLCLVSACFLFLVGSRIPCRQAGLLSSVSRVSAGVNARYQIWVTFKSRCKQTPRNNH